MKKFFSMLLSCVMLVNMGIVAMAADEGHICATSSENLYGIGDFETEGAITKSADGKITSIDNGAVKTKYAQHAWVIGYSLDEAYCGEQCLEVYNGNSSYPVTYVAKGLETGASYKISAYVKLKEKEAGVTRSNNTQIRVRSSEVYTVTEKTDGKITAITANWKDYLDVGSVEPRVSVNSNEYKLVEAEFFIPKTDGNETKNVEFGVTGKLENFYVDDISVVKTGSVAINGATIVGASKEGNVSANYAVSGDCIATADELVLAEEYAGISLENGVLTITPEAQTGTITLGVKKNITRGGTTESEFVITKTVSIHDCIPTSGANILGLGDFETVSSNITYGTGSHAGKITNIENKITSGEGTHCYAVGYSDEAYCGNKSLELYHGHANYPVTFNSKIETGSLYKFSAYIKLKEKTPGTKRTISTNMHTTTQEVYTVTGKDDNNAVDTLIARWNKYQTSSGLPTVTLSSDKWTLVEAEFYAPKTSAATEVSAKFAIITGKIEGFYVDEVSLVKVGSADIIGESKLTAPQQGSITSNYTVSGDGIASTDELVLAEEYTGVTLENGVLTVTSEAEGGVITLGIKKNITRGSATAAEFVVTKTVDIHECIPASSKNLLGIGDFETESSNITYGTGSHAGKITNIENKITSGEGTHCYAVGYSDEAYCGSKSLELYHGHANYPVTFNTKIETGSLYKFSAYIKLKEKTPGTKRTIATNMHTITANVYNVAEKDADGMVKTLIGRWNKYQTPSGLPTVTLSSDAWTLVEAEFYAPNTTSANEISAKFAIATGKIEGFYVDDVSLVKLGSVAIEGKDFLNATEDENVTSTYTLVGEGVVAEDEQLVLAEDYAGITLENGVLTVTPEAQAGTITIGIKKALSNNENGVFIVTKDIELHECAAKAEQNLLTGGDFEETGNFIYYNNNPEDKITGIEGNAVELVFARNSTIKGYSNEAYCGNQSLEVEQGANAIYYPATFKANLEKGAIYKFTAFVKLKDSSTQKSANLLVTTDKTKLDPDGGIYILNDGTMNDIYGAGSPWNTGYNASKHNTTFATTQWTKIERTIYVSDNGMDGTVEAWMGLMHMGGVFDYYIDDVSLVKIGQAKLNGANYIDIPAESTTQSYTFTSDVAADATMALDAEYAGVSYADGVLTVTNEAEAGVVTLQIVSSNKVVAKKAIVLFDETEKVVQMSNDGAGGVSYNAYIKNTIADDAKLLVAKYNGKVFDSVNITNSTSMGDYSKIEKTMKLEDGSYKLMLWQGFETIEPLAEVEKIAVNTTAE